MVYPTLREGSPAYYDGLRGPVPVKVLRITEDPHLFDLTLGCQAASTRYKIQVEVTKTMPGYKKGEVFSTSGFSVFPKECLKRRDYSYIITPFAVEARAHPLSRPV